MAIFIDPTGRSTFGIGVCDRCQRKFSLEDLYSDPNSPGLKVCIEDLDQYDPYRLPARRTEDIALPFYRPDQILTDVGPVPQDESLFAVISANTFVLTTNDDGSGERLWTTPPLPDDVT